MPDTLFNKYRAAVEVLQRGRDVQVEGLADDILDQAEDLAEGGFAFNEFLESQGTRVHFLCLLVAQLEQSADSLDEARQAADPEPEPDPVPYPEPLPSPAPQKRKSRAKPKAKKLSEQAPTGGSSDEA